MKPLKFNISLLLFLLLWSCSLSTRAEKFTKELSQVYSAAQGTQLIIENKYGDININNWDKDSVDIQITITVDTYSEEKAQSLLDNIKVMMSHSGDNIKAITEMSHKFKTGKKFSIDYQIYMPDYVKIDLKNKFGNIYVHNIRAKANIDLSYGNLKGDSFLYPQEKPLSTINLAYSKATITESNRTKLTMKYSTMNIGTSEVLIVVSRFSKLHLDNNISVIADSKYDNFSIRNTDVFMVTMGQFSDFKIDQVNKKLDLELRYGNCKVGYIPKDFEEININNEYISTSLGIDPEASYLLEAETKFCGVSYPENSKTITKMIESSKTTIKAIVGENETPQSKVRIFSKFGNVSLK